MPLREVFTYETLLVLPHLTTTMIYSDMWIDYLVRTIIGGIFDAVTDDSVSTAITFGPPNNNHPFYSSETTFVVDQW